MEVCLILKIRIIFTLSIDSEILSFDTNVAIIQETNKQLEEKLRSKLFNYKCKYGV